MVKKGGQKVTSYDINGVCSIFVREGPGLSIFWSRQNSTFQSPLWTQTLGVRNISCLTIQGLQEDVSDTLAVTKQWFKEFLRLNSCTGGKEKQKEGSG